MTDVVGKRIYIRSTPEELTHVLPINNGQPIEGTKFWTVFGEVTGEMHAGIWLRLERLWSGEMELN